MVLVVILLAGTAIYYGRKPVIAPRVEPVVVENAIEPKVIETPLFRLEVSQKPSQTPTKPTITAIPATSSVSEPSQEKDWTENEWTVQIVGLINASRKNNGLKPLMRVSLLDHVAALKLKDMIEVGYFAHSRPGGKAYTWAFRDAGYTKQTEAWKAGEDLAKDFPTAAQTIQAFYASQTHREVMLDPVYDEIGVAYGHGVIGGKDSYLTVVEFGHR